LVEDLHILLRLPLLSSCFFGVYFENLRPSRSIFCFVCSHGLFISQSIRQPYANFDASHDHVRHFLPVRILSWTWSQAVSAYRVWYRQIRHFYGDSVILEREPTRCVPHIRHNTITPHC
jgi:hypothetical protein